MGMSTHVVGFRPPDDRWQQMKNVYDTCNAAGVPVPAEVDEFFVEGPPDPAGVEVDLDAVAREWTDGDASSGVEISVADLPEHITVLRFYNAW